MPDTSSSRLSTSAAALFLLVVSLLIAPIGALVVHVVAAVTGGNQGARVLVAPDPLSEPPRFSWRLFGLSHAAIGTA